MKKIAIIGAGFSGLVLAKKLQSFADVVVFEKARGVGGRMSSRYAENFTFDHGLPCFEVRSEEFYEFLQPFFHSGLVAQWSGQRLYVDQYGEIIINKDADNFFVACPNMNSLCKYWAQDVSLHLSTEVAPLSEPSAQPHELYDTHGNRLGCYDWVISTAPFCQTERLFFSNITSPIMTPPSIEACHVMLLATSLPWQESWVASIFDHPVWRAIYVNSTKPHRDRRFSCLALHTQPMWTSEHIETELPIVENILLKNLPDIIRLDTDSYDYTSVHRWRYARHHMPQPLSSYCDITTRLAATGDWLGDGDLESAWRQAKALVNNMQSLL